MTGIWFSPEFAENLRWLASLSLLSVLGIYPLKGMHERRVTAVWAVTFAAGSLLLAASMVAAGSGQPSHVVRPLFISGLTLVVVFGGTYGAMRQAYRDAELRKSVAQDL